MPGKLAKPVMRGLLLTWTKKQMFFLLTGCTGIGAGYYFFVGQRRKNAYAEFYKVGYTRCWLDSLRALVNELMLLCRNYLGSGDKPFSRL